MHILKPFQNFFLLISTCCHLSYCYYLIILIQRNPTSIDCCDSDFFPARCQYIHHYYQRAKKVSIILVQSLSRFRYETVIDALLAAADMHCTSCPHTCSMERRAPASTPQAGQSQGCNDACSSGIWSCCWNRRWNSEIKRKTMTHE